MSGGRQQSVKWGRVACMCWQAITERALLFGGRGSRGQLLNQYQDLEPQVMILMCYLKYSLYPIWIFFFVVRHSLWTTSCTLNQRKPLYSDSTMTGLYGFCPPFYAVICFDHHHVPPPSSTTTIKLWPAFSRSFLLSMLSFYPFGLASLFKASFFSCFVWSGHVCFSTPKSYACRDIAFHEGQVHSLEPLLYFNSLLMKYKFSRIYLRKKKLTVDKIRLIKVVR